MPKMYKSITELYLEVKEYKIIDLIPHAVSLKPELSKALIDPPVGLYMPGSIRPLFRNHINYVLRSITDPKTLESTCSYISLKDIEKDIKETKLLQRGDITHDQEQFRINRMSYERIKRSLLPNPNLPVIACEAAIATVISYLNTLCPYTRVPIGRYHLSHLVKPDFTYLIEKEEYEAEFHDLYDEVLKFINDDHWCVYHYRIKGTTLIIEKGLDFRIIEWHKQQIKNSEGYDHDLGGVQDGYEVHASRY